MAHSTISHYSILKKLGTGGMGEVYLAVDTKLDRKVALKILPAEFAVNQDRMRRFVQEAKAAAALNHPNIAHIYEIGESNGMNFIAMEFIVGQTLREYIHLDQATLGKLLRHMQHVAGGLARAHAAGIVHRDLKPDNIMITRDDHAKILDFGLAKLIEPQQSLGTSGDASEVATAIIEQQSTPGVILGTAGYMSPEQAQGKPVDHRSDIFSFGCILFEAATGRRPFEGDSAIDTLHKIIYSAAPPITDFNPDAPADLQRIIRRCLAKEPEKRYQTIRDVANDLEDLRQEIDGGPEPARTIPPRDSTIASVHGSKASGISKTSDVQAPSTSSAEYLVNQIKTHKVGVALMLASLIAVVAALGYLIFVARGPAASIESIAVMPFVNESGNADAEYLSDGMTETLISNLSQLPHLNVKARSTVFRYKGKEFDLQKIAQELKVQAILTGRVAQRGDQLTLSLELVDAQTGNVIWNEQYNRKQADLVILQSEIARDVSSKLKIKLAGADQLKLAKNYTDDPEAYRLYLQGRFYWNKRTNSEVEKAIPYFQQAVEKDPHFALGYVGLADSDEDRDRSTKKAYIRRALEIDDHLAEAHASLGYQYMLDYNWAASERELKRAMELNPNYPQSYAWNGARLMMIDKYDESLAAIQRALELDPTSNGINFYKAVCLGVAGRRDEAIQEFKKLIQMDPTFPWAHGHLARIYRLNGDYAAAVEERAISYELDGKPEAAKATRDGFLRGGWEGVRRSMQQEGPDSLFWGILGETDKEKWIARLMQQAERGNFWLFLIKTDPSFDPLRDDPRFQQLLKKFNPPQ